MGCCFSSDDDAKEPLLIEETNLQTPTLPETQSLSDFEILEILGKGAFGKTYLVIESKSGEKLAMKKLRKDIKFSETLFKFLERISFLSYPSKNISQIKHVLSIERRNYIISEYIQGESLLEHILKNQLHSEQSAREFGAQILLGLEFLHWQGLVHKNLKWENVMIDEWGQVKLTDYGFFREQGEISFVGASEFISPETANTGKIESSSDFWALGVLLYEIMTGHSPFQNRENEFRNENNKEIPIPATISEQAADILRKLLNQNPFERVRNFDIVKKHPFFEGVDWNSTSGSTISGIVSDSKEEMHFPQSFLSHSRKGVLKKTVEHENKSHPYDLTIRKVKHVSESSVSELSEKLHEQEVYTKFYKDKVIVLEKKIEGLEKELLKAQEINKILLEEKLSINSSDMNYYIEELIVEDTKRELEETKINAEENRMETERFRMKNEKLIKENLKLEASMKRYRRLAEESSPELRTSTTLILPNIKNSSLILQSPVTTKDRLKNSQISLLSAAVFEFLHTINLKEILHCLTKACKKILKCNSCTVFILSENIEKEYLDIYESFRKIFRIQIDNQWVIIHTEDSTDFLEPVFKSIQEISKGIRNSEELVIPLPLYKENAIIVQCEQPNKSPFEENDEFLLRVLINSISLSIRSYLSKKSEVIFEEYIENLTKITSKIAHCKTHYELSNVVDKILPEFCSFQGVGIVYYDEKVNEFFSNAQSSSLTEKYSEDYVKFPATIGVSSEVIKCKQSKVYQNIKRKAFYNPEIDNIAGVSDLRNLVVSLLIGPEDKIMGVLQLGNKKGENISKKDEKLVEDISLIIGNVVSAINSNVEALDLTVKLKRTIGNLQEGAKADLMSEHIDANLVRDELEVMRNMVSVWAQMHGGV